MTTEAERSGPAFTAGEADRRTGAAGQPPAGALPESEERFGLVAESAPAMLWMGDPNGKCLYLNRLQREFWGVAANEVPTFDWNRTLHPDDVEALGAPFIQGMRTRTGFTVEARYRRASDGLWRILKTTAQPRFSAEGAFLGMIGVNVDVSEQRAAEEQLRALNETLEARVAEEINVRQQTEAALHQAQKMESIGQLTGGIAHDFNNLLMAVMGSLELLQKRLPDDPQLTRLIDNAMEGARRGSALTSRMLSFARRQDLRIAAVDIPALFGGMADLLQSSLGSMIAIETAFPADLPPVLVDPAQLETALINIAVNARDALHDSGTITITASEASVTRESGLEPGHYVRLAITDTGEGMDEATLSRAREPFFTTKGVGRGTGLGLSMVHGLAQQSGGRLVLRSTPGEGTTAEIWLPVATADRPAAVPEAPQPAPGREEVRPLVVMAVDDDALVRMNTVAMLEDLGHTVVEAHSGHDALEKFEHAGVDVVITDHAMPLMSGTQLAAALHARRPDLPIVLATGYAELPDGADPGLPRLAKPFTQAQLASLMQAILG
jgi:PAS domain S-box-containing protein